MVFVAFKLKSRLSKFNPSGVEGPFALTRNHPKGIPKGILAGGDPFRFPLRLIP